MRRTNRYLNRCQYAHLRRLIGAELASNPAVVAAWLDARAVADHETLTSGGVTWQPYATRADPAAIMALLKFCRLARLECRILPYAGDWHPMCHRIEVTRRADGHPAPAVGAA